MRCLLSVSSWRLSTTTVSHVISKSRNVSREIRELVLCIAEELGYHHGQHRPTEPAPIERIGVITADIQEDYYVLLVKTIETIASERGISVLFCDSANDREKERRNISFLLGKNVNALIVSPVTSCAYPDELRHAEVPIVLVDRQYEDHNTTFVGINNAESAISATRHLVEKGCRNIGFIGYPESVFTMKQRVLGYKLGLLHHLPLTQPKVLYVKYRMENSHQLIKDFLLENTMDGIICGTSEVCYQLLSVVNELDNRIPKDLRILTYDHNRWLDLLRSPLSVVTQPVVEIGNRAVDVVLQKTERVRLPNGHKTEVLFGVKIEEIQQQS